MSMDVLVRAPVGLLPVLLFLVALLLFGQTNPHSRLGRTIDVHLGQLADPASWTP